MVFKVKPQQEMYLYLGGSGVIDKFVVLLMFFFPLTENLQTFAIEGPKITSSRVMKYCIHVKKKPQ